jgi:hypothetical protein
MVDDTCDGISAQFGISGVTLRANNPQIHADCDLYVGEV